MLRRGRPALLTSLSASANPPPRPPDAMAGKRNPHLHCPPLGRTAASETSSQSYPVSGLKPNQAAETAINTHTPAGPTWVGADGRRKRREPARTARRGVRAAGTERPVRGAPARSARYSPARRVERETGIEPATNSLEGCDSTTELLPPSRFTLRRARPPNARTRFTPPAPAFVADASLAVPLAKAARCLPRPSCCFTGRPVPQAHRHRSRTANQAL